MKRGIQKPGSIRTRTIKTLIILFVLLIAGITFTLSTIMINRIGLLEKRYAEEHVERAQNAIKSEVVRISSVVNDWAPWDDTYTYIQDGNEDYIKNNLFLSTYSTIKVDVMVFIDNSGKFIYSGSVNKAKNEIQPASDSLLEFLGKSPICKNTDPEFQLKGIIMTAEGPLIIAAYPILTSEFKGPVHGNLVFGRYLDEEEVSKLSKDLNLSLSFKTLDQSELSGYYSGNTAISFRDLNNNKIVGSSILKDIYGQPILKLNVEMGRDISKIGREGIISVLILLFILSVIFIFILLIFIDKSILCRLVELCREIKAIGNERAFYNRLKPQSTKDEISVVSDEINNMLNQLEESQKKIVKNEQELMEANGSLEIKVRERTNELLIVNEELKKEIKEREIVQEKMKQLAYHDSLTGLPNRLLFNDLLNHAIYIANRYERMITVMYLDLDGFKMVNDTMGHAAGDQLIKEVTVRLQKVLRKSDVIARIGGDEFIIMIENCEDADDIKVIAGKILNSFKGSIKINDQDCFVTTSIGIAVYPADGQDAEAIVKNADIAMYKAKEKGKNQYVICSPVMKTTIIENMKLTNKLYRALEKNELEVCYQPQVNCRTKRIMGVEALLRWNSPEMGVIPPGKFIPIAERTGLILPIGEWTMRTAFKQNKLWQEAGYPLINMAVNISIKQFQNPDLVKQVSDIIAETGLDPKNVELEITESMAMSEKSYIVETLKKFKDIGLHIAIDDFGTEYSSLSYLKHLPIDRIKIAMSFVQGLEAGNKDEAIIKAIIVLAKSMGLGTIAEGVETEYQLDYLKSEMCDEVQGFYYFKPMSASDMERLLKETKL